VRPEMMHTLAAISDFSYGWGLLDAYAPRLQAQVCLHASKHWRLQHLDIPAFASGPGRVSFPRMIVPKGHPKYSIYIKQRFKTAKLRKRPINLSLRAMFTNSSVDHYSTVSCGGDL
jgi:hypothetical protein